MIQGLNYSESAIKAYGTSVANSANNIANINTPYYKSNSLQLAELKNGGVEVSSIRQNQQYSYTIQSGRTLDFVIEGGGNFMLDDGGDPYLTRKGTFYIDGEGSITDSQGRVLADNILRQGETASQIDVETDGSISVNEEYRGKIDIYDSYGNKMPENLYSLKSGMLEVSDVNYAREVVDMMVSQNATSANFSMIRTYNEMLGLIVNLVA